MTDDHGQSPLDLSLPEGEREARKKYLELLQRRPDYLGCWDCLMVFQDFVLFSLHHAVHDSSRTLTCTCGTPFPTRADFHRHVIEQPHKIADE